MAVDDAYTVVLMHFDGPDNYRGFLDESGKPWIPVADAQLDTAQYKFNNSSVLFDGSGDYLYSPNNADFGFGTGDFTFDCWIRRNGTKAYPGIWGSATSGGNGFNVHLGNSDNKVRVVWDNTEKILTVGTIADLTWTHLAVVRNGNAVSVYLDGSADANTDDCTGDTINSSNDGAVIGRVFTNYDNYYWAGWLAEVRVSKGIARWTGNFTPPIFPYAPPDVHNAIRGRTRLPGSIDHRNIS